VLNEFYRVAFRKNVYRFIDELQADLDVWIHEYNETRPHLGRWCLGKTPMQTFLDAMPMTKEKMIAASSLARFNPAPGRTLTIRASHFLHGLRPSTFSWFFSTWSPLFRWTAAASSMPS
jgi:hypothetical protein